MFEVGFSELLMTGLVALLVIGPEKLPKAARIAGLWVGRLNYSLSSIRAEVQRELHAEEMRQLLQENSIGQDLQRIADETAELIQTGDSTSNSSQAIQDRHAPNA